MKKTSTFVGKVFAIFAIFSLFLNSTNAQTTCTAPAMTWKSPVLFSGIAGQVNAVYKFPEVTPGVYALIKIDGLVNGATLTNIDDSTFGYTAAWQPVVKTPATILSTSYVKFKIEFKNNNGSNHKYQCFQLSFIDVDGDNVGVKEFVAAKNPDSYSVSNITTLTISNLSGSMVKAQGTLINYPDIDTTSYRTNINYKYTDQEKVDEIWVGNATLASFTVQDRYTCGYFAQITMPYQTLPLKYLSFDGVAADNKVTLKWLTTQEVNTSHFEVERSFDMNSYSVIGMVLDGFTVNGTDKSYQFKDHSPELKDRAVVYYRLRQFDKDGKASYSKILAVRLQSATDIKMQTSPNPFTENLNVSFKATENGTAQIRIINIAGQTLLSKQSAISKGYNSIQVDGLRGLATGMYVAQLIMNGTVIDNQRVIKNY